MSQHRPLPRCYSHMQTHTPARVWRGASPPAGHGMQSGRRILTLILTRILTLNQGP